MKQKQTEEESEDEFQSDPKLYKPIGKLNTDVYNDEVEEGDRE